MSRLVVGILWLLHWLPLGAQAAIGQGLGALLYRVARARRHIVDVNLRLCFPGLDERDRRRLAQAHFRVLGRSMVERGVLWFAPRERLARLIKVEGIERVQALLADKRPVILLAPHFVGLDAGGVAITMNFDIVSIYAKQSDPVIDHWLHFGRSRFGDQLLVARAEGARPTVKAMKAGRPFYYLPDMDYRRKDSIFVPFFGVQAATITGLSRLSRLAGAVVVPCATRMLPGGQGYVVEIGAPWEDFPSNDIASDTLRMNQCVETLILTMPEQYYWVHRRFKTRPHGEDKLY